MDLMLTFLFTKRITLKMKINKKLISSILLIIFSGFLLWFFSVMPPKKISL